MELKKYKLADIAKIEISGVDKKTMDGETHVRLCNFVDVYYNWAITKEKAKSFMVASAKQAEIDKCSIGKGMVAITKDSETIQRFGLSDADVYEAIKSACDFFNIPMPRMIQDLTNVQDGQTMFVNWDRGSYYDDVLCFNMQQLIDMKVDSKDAFSLVMTHECGHRVLQNTQFPGVANGQWESELCPDFFMGCRAGLWNMNAIDKVVMGLILTDGSPSHPEGTLRALFIRHGKYIAPEMHRRGIPLTIQNLINEFIAFRQQNLNEILNQQHKYYRF